LHVLSEQTNKQSATSIAPVSNEQHKAILTRRRKSTETETGIVLYFRLLVEQLLSERNKIT